MLQLVQVMEKKKIIWIVIVNGNTTGWNKGDNGKN
jgi:hypothetical protein